MGDWNCPTKVFAFTCLSCKGRWEFPKVIDMTTFSRAHRKEHDERQPA